MEATVHLLDLADAVGGVQPSDNALTATRDLLIAVPDATTAVEVLAAVNYPRLPCRRSANGSSPVSAAGRDDVEGVERGRQHAVRFVDLGESVVVRFENRRRELVRANAAFP
jgi:hypothetical protein